MAVCDAQIGENERALVACNGEIGFIRHPYISEHGRTLRKLDENPRSPRPLGKVRAACEAFEP